jgi:hypothetical protein
MPPKWLERLHNGDWRRVGADVWPWAIRVGLPFKRLLQSIMLNGCRLVELPGGEQ